MVGRDDPQVDVRRTTLVTDRARPLEPEPARRSVTTVALPARTYCPSRFACQRWIRAPASGRQSTEERTIPVRTWPVPIFARCGGAPRPNGPEPSSSVGRQPVAVGGRADAGNAETRTMRQAADASSLTPEV